MKKEMEVFNSCNPPSCGCCKIYDDGKVLKILDTEAEGIELYIDCFNNSFSLERLRFFADKINELLLENDGFRRTLVDRSNKTKFSEDENR